MFLKKYTSKEMVPKFIEIMQESALRFMLKDQIDTYEQLLKMCNYATLHMHIKCL